VRSVTAPKVFEGSQPTTEVGDYVGQIGLWYSATTGNFAAAYIWVDAPNVAWSRLTT
jgi:hypothetical protein